MPAAVASKSKAVTFTLTATPGRLAERKTIERLMRMNPGVQKGLKRLGKRRRREDNYSSPRAGREWITRMPATKLVRAEKGEKFTLAMTPQIRADLRSVEKYLSPKPG